MTAFWWAAGEEIEFPNKGAGVVTNAPGGVDERRTAWVRGALGGLDDPPKGGLSADGFPITPRTDLWLSCEYSVGGNPLSGGVYYPEIGLARSAVTNAGVFLGRQGGSASVNTKCVLIKVSSAGVITPLQTEAGNSWDFNTLHRIDMHITGFNTATATVVAYLEGNDAPTINWTGDLTGLGLTDLDCVRALSNGTGGAAYLSEVILADEDTRGFAGVFSMAPNAAGDTNTFTGGTYASIDEVVLDDADRVESAVVGQEIDANLSDITAPGATGVRGIKLTARAVKGATGPGTLQLGINLTGTRNTVDKTLTTALASYERLMTVNPITGVAFTLTEANALQLCLKSAT